MCGLTALNLHTRTEVDIQTPGDICCSVILLDFLHAILNCSTGHKEGHVSSRASKQALHHVLHISAACSLGQTHLKDDPMCRRARRR